MSVSGVTPHDHVFVPASGSNVTLLLLHGTGGNEHDLVPLGRELLPGAALLSPRGRVLEHGMPRFFRRIAEGVFDVPDLQQRADDLARWVREQLTVRAAPTHVMAVGFSNGANIAAALLLRAPGLLGGGVLFRAMVPYTPEVPPVRTETRVLLSQGVADPIVPRAQTDALATLLRATGSTVEVAWQQAGHGLVQADVRAAAAFLGSAGTMTIDSSEAR
jgi:phospholipase/carboxylesterase